MITKEIQIDGMSCQHCVMAVKKALSKLNLESFDVTIGSAKVTYEEEKVKLEDIIKVIEDNGYKVKSY